MIPLVGFKSVDKTIESVLLQRYLKCEIIILRNNIDLEEIPGRCEVYENDTPMIKYNNVLIREVFIHKRGKGNALNIGARKAKYDLLCVLDADCVLDKNAFAEVAADFADENVIAVGGKLIASTPRQNILTFLQQIEYDRTFNISRNIFNLLDANCLISGAFGIFRKREFFAVKGYDTDTVGEDMELVLRLQEMFKPLGKKIIYNHESVCYTNTPHTLLRLLRQRDRWQRGLLDCFIKRRKLLFNHKYGMLGLIVLPYQLIFELLGPIFILCQPLIIAFIAADFEPFFCLLDILDFLNILGIIDRFSILPIYGSVFGFETALTCVAECKAQKKRLISGRMLIRAIASTLIGALMFFPLASARLFGMITFHWRKLEW